MLAGAVGFAGWIRLISIFMMDFADGLRAFFSRGSGVEPVRMNNRMKAIIREMIQDSMNDTFNMKEWEHDRFMMAMTWLQKQIGDTKAKIRLNKKIAWTVHCWMDDNRFSHLAHEKDYDKAMQWIHNKLAVRYSQSEMASSGWKN